MGITRIMMVAMVQKTWSTIKCSSITIYTYINHSITCRDFEGCHQLVNLDLAHNQIALVSGAFQGLRGLNKINLIGNDIVCVDRESLESLTNVEEIEIDLRYLQCSCGNDWVRVWIVKKT